MSLLSGIISVIDSVRCHCCQSGILLTESLLLGFCCCYFLLQGISLYWLLLLKSVGFGPGLISLLKILSA